MSKLTIKIPPELGPDYAVADASEPTEPVGTVAEPTPTVVRWAECWAGRDYRIPADGR